MKPYYLIILAVVAGACTKQSLKNTYDKQATYIESFVTAQMKSDTTATLVRNEGAYRLTLHDTLASNKTADSLHLGGQVTMSFATYTLTSSSVSTSNLIETNKKDVATAASWSLSDTTIFTPTTLRVDNALVPGLRMGLQGVQPGDEAYILFTGEYGFGNKENGTIPAKSALVYHVWIDSIKNE